MIKKSIFIFIISLIFSGCVERAALITPKAISKTEKVSSTKNQNIPILRLKNSKEDALQKGISGSLILIIGLILVL